MERNEPTTGEIVRALRNCLDVGCEECILHETDITPEYKVHYCGAPNKVADRLEAQERTIADKDAKIAALTARAEQAEKQRDAAIADLDALKDSGFCNSCVGCNAPHSESITYCTDWKRRGLPQDGEGV
jgi:hypothetical protein